MKLSAHTQMWILIFNRASFTVTDIWACFDLAICKPSMRLAIWLIGYVSAIKSNEELDHAMVQGRGKWIFLGTEASLRKVCTAQHSHGGKTKRKGLLLLFPEGPGRWMDIQTGVRRLSGKWDNFFYHTVALTMYVIVTFLFCCKTLWTKQHVEGRIHLGYYFIWIAVHHSRKS